MLYKQTRHENMRALKCKLPFGG